VQARAQLGELHRARRGLGAALASQDLLALRRTLGPALFVTLAPWCPTLALRVEVDGQAVKPEATGWGSGLRCAVSFEAAGEHEVRFVLK
jgi:hypothetical protein